MDIFGFSETEWNCAKNEAHRALVERAKVRDTMTYTELAGKIRTIQFEAHDLRLNHLIGQVSKEENTAGRGMLSVIVVHKTGDGQPGDGFFELANQLGRNTSDKMQCWINELNKVYACWSP